MEKRRKYCNLFAAAALALAVVSPATASAELLLNENFDYPVGNLYQQGGWIRACSATQQTGNITVVNTPLTYSGYQDGAAGKAAKCVNGSYDALAIAFSNEPQTSGKYYAAFIVDVQAAPGEAYQFASFAGKNYSAFTDGNSGITSIGKLFIKGGASADKIKFGYSKNGAVGTSTYGDDVNLGKHLVVMSYEFVDGSTNDIFQVWIDPVCSKTEPVATYNQSNTADFSTTNGMQGLRFYMGKSTGVGAELSFDAVHVATSWADLFSESGEGGGGEVTPPSGDASITPAAMWVNFADNGYGMLLQGQTVTKTLNIKAENLTSNITVEHNVTGLSTVNTIPAAQACSENGYDLELKYTATGEQDMATLTLKSEGAEDVAISLTFGEFFPTTACNTTLALKNADQEGLCCYTGTMGRVTYVDAANMVFYFEDMAGAIKVQWYDGNAPFKVGDKVKNMYLGYAFEDAATFYIQLPELATVTATENYKEPSEVNFNDITGDLESYLYRLVKVSDVTFKNVPAGAKWGTANVEASDEYGSGRVRAFAGSDLADVDVAASAPSVTGISTSASIAVITMRSSADLGQAEPEMTVTPELKINQTEYQTVGQKVEYAKFKVNMVNMPKVSVWMSGANASQFELSSEEIAAGTGVAEVTVWYNPTTTGAHKANITFESNITSQNVSFAMNAKAYDPANPPVIAVDASTLTDFSAKAGETQAQTISYTSTALLDYGKIAIEAPASGMFQISTGSMMKNGTYTVTITFRPTADGTYSDKIVFSADKAQTVEITVKGTAGVADAETKQGDALVYDTSNPLKSYSTDFTTAIANNQPISLEGWKNCATIGTRAWWSYTKDGNSAAKATLYDSKADNDADAQMLLLSPALDFKDATERLLCFDIMGENMLEDSDGTLMVVYVDPTDPNNPYIEAISGLAIPCSADENGEVATYVLDMHDWDLPDTFFIGFLYQGSRGRNNSAVYYVDNFSWGRTDVPFIRTSHRVIEGEANVNKQFTTDEISIEGKNLTEPISLSLSGEHASAFSLSHNELPAEGGKFTVSFQSENEAQHNAWLTLKSGNDAQTIMSLSIDNKKETGVENIVFDADITMSVYDIAGRSILVDAPADQALRTMHQNRGTLYIVRTSAGNTFRYLVK